MEIEIIEEEIKIETYNPKEFCVNGHEKTPENVDKRNRCKICYHEADKKCREKYKEKRNENNRKYYHNNKEKVTKVIEKSRLKRMYGITIEEYHGMLSKQKNVCAICGNDDTENKSKFAIDHNHKTGKVRGLLCHKCNRGLGSFNDNFELLQSAVKYLKENE